MNQFLQIFIVGFAILVGAILINFFANLVGITTWFVFMNSVKEFGFNVISKENIVSLIFLFVVYPFLLGVIGYYVSLLLKF